MLKKILLGLAALIVLIVIAGVVYYRVALYKTPLITDEDRAAVTLMPLPAKMELKNGALDLSKGINIEIAGQENETVSKAVTRFSANLEQLFQIGKNEDGPVIKINCLNPSNAATPLLNDDESYSLKIGNEIDLTANSQWGINHGLETLLQLIKNNSGATAIPKLEMADQPRFAWRGLMLDVSRHWMPKEVVLRVLDAMAAVKMNTFHWHLSDDQGFRVQSLVFPGLQEQGSDGKFYTQSEIKEIINYAADRGIRIIPEFDMPGHSKSWQIAYPELGTSKKQIQLKQAEGLMFSPPLDPASEDVYSFLDQFIGEMAVLFPDPYFHIGGDEVDSKYWDNDPAIQQFMKENSLADTHALQAYFNKRVQPILTKYGKKMAGWQEILHPDLGNNILIQSWNDHKTLFKGVQSGANAILSAGWYLDLKLHAEDYYKVDPLLLPGAVDIVPDTANWKQYDLVIDFASNEIDGGLVLFDKDPNNVYGFFELLNNRVAFKSGKIVAGEIQLEFNSSMGKIKFNGTVSDKNLKAKMSMALLSFDCDGTLTGGSEIPGTSLPKIEVMRPLTNEEQSRIFGGETAMWSEVVSKDNVDSRIWPSAAVIAEKLWSPAELTGNTDDMYRRLANTSEYLATRGSNHLKQGDAILKALISPEGLPYLKNFVTWLEEVKYYGRLSTIMGQGNLYLPDLPLNGIVDAARPESFEARKFNRLVESYVAAPNDPEGTDITIYLNTWSNLNDQLQPYINTEDLEKAAKILAEFSDVSKALLNKLEQNTELTSGEKDALSEKISFLENGENGMLLAVAPGLRNLLNF